MTKTTAILTAALLMLAPQLGQAADGSFFSNNAKTQSGALAKAIATPAEPADIEAAENALADLWARAPYATRHVTFVGRKAELYGDYDPRASNVFSPGEKLITYIEPIGYGWRPLGANTYEFGVTTDFEILTRGGKVLGGQKAFQEVNLKSHYRNREFFLTLTLNIDAIDPGDYVLAYTLHDTVTTKTTRVEQPFSIRASS
jgi:hypothetical protein